MKQINAVNKLKFNVKLQLLAHLRSSYRPRQLDMRHHLHPAQRTGKQPR
jgi:hypothetical protein